MNRKYFLFDRNVVSIIKDSAAGKPQKDIKKIKMLGGLKSIDRKRSFISPVLSIIEGQKGEAESDEETKKTLEKECSAISHFFKKAHTDSPLLLNNSENFINSIDELKYGNQHYYIFLEKCSDLLNNKLQKNKALKMKDVVFGLAKANNIQINHPVVICCLSVLFHNDNSRKVLKPHIIKSKFNNVISDLRAVSVITLIMSINKRERPNETFNIEFLTLDESLKQFLNSINILDVGFINDYNNQVTVNYIRQLFPLLSDDEYLDLSKELEYF